MRRSDSPPSAPPRSLPPVEKLAWPGSTLLAPIPPVLVSCGGFDGLKANLITVAWAGIVCSQPPMLSISVRPERFSHASLLKTGEFVVNLPTAAMAAAVDWCGVVSGRQEDKFARTGLTAAAATTLRTPIVQEAPVSLECRVLRTLELGSHTLFLAEIAALQVTKSLVDAKGRLCLEKADLLAYAHGHYFSLGECLGHFGFSVRKKPGPKIRR